MDRKPLNISLAVLVAILAAIAAGRHFRGAESLPPDGASGRHPSAIPESGGRHPAARIGALPTSGLGVSDIDYGLLRDILVARARDAPFQTLADDGRITQGALEFVGVDVARRREIQQVFDTAFKQVEDGIRARMRQVPVDGEGDDGVSIYEIPAAREEGEEIVRGMVGNLANIIGERKAMALLSGMDLTWKYSSFGMRETRIEIRPSGADDIRRQDFLPGRAYGVKIAQTDPDTGRVFVRDCYFDTLEQCFGGLFALSDAE